jgi:AcrR family transcriptional regulator
MATERKTKGTAADRLTQALQTLTRRTNGDGPEKVTVAELCRLAFVSRNSLYRYHTGVLKCFRKYQRGYHRAGESKVSVKDQQLRSENASLRQQLTKLAALVDHYYLAYREACGLLERRERELADLRRSFTTRPIALAR